MIRSKKLANGDILVTLYAGEMRHPGNPLIAEAHIHKAGGVPRTFLSRNKSIKASQER